jgi:uncharacterized protein
MERQMEKAIQDFISCKRIAVIGVSSKGKKFGNGVFSELRKRGYDVSIVHPQAQEIDGTRCFANLTALKDQLDGIVVSVPPPQALKVLRDAASISLKNVWLQRGAESPEALVLAKELGLNLVTKKCVLMYMEPVRSIHAFHRTLARWFGKY